MKRKKSEKIQGGEGKVREKRREKTLSVRSRNKRHEKGKRWWTERENRRREKRKRRRGNNERRRDRRGGEWKQEKKI